MERLQDFYERQVVRLLMLAHDCTDTKTQKTLTQMASDYLDKLDIVAAEKLIERQAQYRIVLPSPRR